MAIAVTGANGQLGRLAIAALRRRVAADEVVALARDPAKVADAGVPVRAFDYDRAETLAPALAGIDTLVLISSTDLAGRIGQHRAVIAAAQAAGVRRVAYTSLLRADTSPLSLAQSHRTTEADLRASGLGFTVLRNGWYTENYTPSIPAALDHGAFVGSSGEGRISAAARADYAEAIAVVATSDGHDGRTYELAGDDAFTLAEFAAELSRGAGRAIPYRDLPEADYAAILAAAGLPDEFAHALASWEVAASRGALLDDGRRLSALIERPTTPMSETVAQAVASLLDR